MLWAAPPLARECHGVAPLFFSKFVRRMSPLVAQPGHGAVVGRRPLLKVPDQPVDATRALNLSAGVSNCKVSRGRSFS